MLSYLGIGSVDDLFSDIPQKVRKSGIDLPDGISELELTALAESVASMNRKYRYSFLGCGVYDRFVPAVVDTVISRGEFLTSYTPYQPEVSQGTLQALFEYQSLMSQLMAMDVTNSSMYDGFTALGEAVRMAFRINGRHQVLLPENIYTRKLGVIRNYTIGLGMKEAFYRVDRSTGSLDIEDLKGKVGSDTCAVVVENPNSFGILDPEVRHVREVIGDAVLIAYVDPVSLGIVVPPGEYGADIAVAEGQQLGMRPNFGGPFLGIMSFREEYVRKSPGRIIGESVDSSGRRAFVMTLQTREQHIRRQRAMSNICTNQALMALAASVYLATLGPEGLRAVASRTVEMSSRLISSLSSLHGISAGPFRGTYFSDVPVKVPYSREELRRRLESAGIAGGIPLPSVIQPLAAEFPDTYFFSVTEKTTDQAIAALAQALGVE
ncbi:putative glycine dehydrogenase (decarboxylating) subunit 1 [Thermogymnomonas acidicola]|uniref:Glycine dehydrogenase (Decarboxylating) subunit 1 n=2 Tax=Thermogymnomonas acidicola TaxID=399579 RepID=A0AA37BPU2_9ARCH|nr:putative glycine dehydrogenase (decarboxylating) subunit 1 [Thermogymnomonas acidicola]